MRVVELAQWVFVPVAGALLADWGADVVRIERPEGDPYRGLDDPGHRHRQRRRQPVGRARQPRQAVGRRSTCAPRRARGPHGSSRPPTCSSPTSGPARCSASGSTPRRSPSATRRWSTRVATATACAVPTPTAPATTRRRSGRAGLAHVLTPPELD